MQYFLQTTPVPEDEHILYWSALTDQMVRQQSRCWSNEEQQ